MDHRASTIDSLDGLRGLAAIGVVILHACESFGLEGYAGHLYLAVPLFFQLSGYVVARAYERRLADGMTLGRFAAIRASRLAPLLVLSCMIAWGLGAAPVDALAAALLIPSMGGAVQMFPANSPIWSLFLEVWGNAFHAIFRSALRFRMVIAFLLLGAAGVVVSAVHLGDLAVGWAHGNFASGVAVFVFSYCTGIAIWRLEQAGRDPSARRIPFAWLATVYVLAVAYPQSDDAGWAGLRDAIVVLALFPALVIAARHAILSARMARLCRVAGAISYPLYILHHPIVHALCVALRPVTTTPERYALIAPMLVFCGAIAWAADRWYDRPVRALLNARRVAPAAAAAAR